MKLLTNAEISEKIDTRIFRLLSDTVDEMGLEAYIVGGYVRDMLLERPSKDVDVVVVGSGIEVAKAFAKKLGRGAHCSYFKNFGTAQVKWRGEEIEFVGARKESYHRDSRKPIVEDGTLEDDQRRRDFTINAMAICLNHDRFGELVDPFDGIYDLEDGIVATPLDPDVTFSDDPLRMLRCVRFATQLKFVIEEETFEALERNQERIKIISQERIISELNKIILSPTPSYGFVELQRCGLLQLILPEVAALDLVEERNGRKHKNNFYHTLEVLDNVAKNTAARLSKAGKEVPIPVASAEGMAEPALNAAPPTVTGPLADPKERVLFLRWAALLHDIGKPRSKRWDPLIGWTFHNHNYLGMKMVKPLFNRMKLPLDERMKYVQKLVDLHMRPINIADDEVTDSAVRRLLFDAGDDIDDLMLLCEADITSKNEQRKKGFRENYQLVRKKLVDIEEKDRIRNFQPPVDGIEIMERFSLQPCKEVGILKMALKDAILDGIVPNDHNAALTFIDEKAQELGLTVRS